MYTRLLFVGQLFPFPPILDIWIEEMFLFLSMILLNSTHKNAFEGWLYIEKIVRILTGLPARVA